LCEFLHYFFSKEEKQQRNVTIRNDAKLLIKQLLNLTQYLKPLRDGATDGKANPHVTLKLLYEEGESLNFWLCFGQNVFMYFWLPPIYVLDTPFNYEPPGFFPGKISDFRYTANGRIVKKPTAVKLQTVDTVCYYVHTFLRHLLIICMYINQAFVNVMNSTFLCIFYFYPRFSFDSNAVVFDSSFSGRRRIAIDCGRRK
jgi:hypothetical protein